MRHANQFLRLHTAHNRSDAARLVGSLIEHEQVRATLGRAKTAMRLTDRMISLAKAGTLASRRQAASFLGEGPALGKLFKEIGKRYLARQGGFTRLIRDFPRKGDGAPMAILELVDRVVKPVTTQKKSGKGKEKTTADTKAPAKKLAAAGQASK